MIVTSDERMLRQAMLKRVVSRSRRIPRRGWRRQIDVHFDA